MTAAARAADSATADRNAASAYLLGNGAYAVLLTRAGAGYSACEGSALNRWTPDPVRQTQGYFLYVRDLDSGASWSAGFEPLARAPARYDVHVHDHGLELVREDDGIETRMEVCVAPDAAVELRRLTLTDLSGRARRLDVTTCLEVVLADLRSDAAHPVFSKLFVQTAWLPEARALLAWRRPRSREEAPPWLVHRLIVDGARGRPGDSAGAPHDHGAGAPLDDGVSFETDRRRFLGRGRSPADPHALDAGAALSGTTGSVLDPVCSVRRALAVPAHGSVTLTALLAVASGRSEAEAIAHRYDTAADVEHVFAAAGASDSVIAAALHPGRPLPEEALASWRALGLPPGWEHGAHAVPAPPTEADIGEPPAFRAARSGAASPDRCAADEPLRFFNGIGGFTEDGLEYVLRLEQDGDRTLLPPVPWTNVVANERIGFIATESGAGYTWAGNSRRYRMTPWSNDPVADPHGDAIYIRDEDAGTFWSPTPGPAPGAGGYEVRHGLGYTRYVHTGEGLDQDLCVFVPRSDPVRIALLTLRNRTDRPRRLTLFAYARWVLGGKAQETSQHIVTSHAADASTILAVNGSDPDPSISFAALSRPSACGSVRVTADRAAFLGPFGSMAAPAAVVTADSRLDDVTGAHLDPCAAFQTPCTLQPGETISLALLIGNAGDEQAVSDLVARYGEPTAIQAALADVRAFWRDLVGGIRVHTPSPAIDLMANGWLAYQTLSCRMWGRSAFYQSGGAFGFRDQLQDAAALIHIAPRLTRDQILLHAAHQFREGDVLHWWHPPESMGIRTRFSDDLLWLPYITTYYLSATGDDALLDERVRFITGPALDPGEDERMMVPDDSGDDGTLHEHCCRAIDRSLTRGAHGLPLIGVGDWNDGMNRVGREGRGESVWLGFFLYRILTDYIPLCERRGDTERAARYAAYRDELALALQDGGWDGAWYRRAYYDDGTPIGSAQNDECRIDAIAQAWAVLSGAAPPDRAALALDALEEHLVAEDDGLIRLLTPPFDCTQHDPGYIRGYLPGVRENGGQYTHGALWAVSALAEAGRVERAARLLEMLSPVSHTRTPEQVAVYQAEPYVIAADVYGQPPHVGRAGWTWYTGSSGWMLRVTLESVLGLRVDRGHALRLRPRIPASWPGYSLSYRVPGTGTRYEIDVRREVGALLSARLDDGSELAVEEDVVLIPLVPDGGVHRVSVVMPV